MIVKIKDRDSESIFGCGDVDGCDSSIDNYVDDGSVNINAGDDAKNGDDTKVDFEDDDGQFFEINFVSLSITQDSNLSFADSIKCK